MGISFRDDGDRFEARLVVDQLWEGTPLAESLQATVILVDRPGRGIDVRLDAPHHHDPRPAVPPGRLDGLWAYEVVELFLLGHDERYLEIEVGPGGHYLALAFAGRRVRVDEDVPIRVEVERGPRDTEGTAGRWTAGIRVSEASLPPGWREGGRRCNAYTIHGPSDARRYAVAQVLGTDEPDFHAIAAFASLTHP